MSSNFEMILSVLRGATPLILAALAGLFSERSGVVQIALEGMMLIGALAGATIAFLSHSAYLGFFAAILAGIIVVSVYGLFAVNLRSNQIVAGTALNLLAAGIAPFVTKIVFDSTGSTPGLEIADRFTWEPILFAAVALGFSHYIFKYTKIGLQIRFAGEKPEALVAAGTSVKQVRWIALCFCGALAGAAGSTLSLFLASSYSPNMTAGRGFMALAALIFGKWRALPAAGACLLFASFDLAQALMQGNETGIPVQFIQIIPYAVTIIALAGFFGRSKAPAAIGQALDEQK